MHHTELDPQPGRGCIRRLATGIVVLLLGTSVFHQPVRARADSLLSVASADPVAGVKLKLTGAGATPMRLEVSTDLDTWTPVELFPISTDPAILTDTFASGRTTRFYRAAAVKRVPEIYRFSTDRAVPGDSLELIGQFFGSSRSENQVVLGGIPLNVTEASGSRLKVRIPTGATSGFILLTTPDGPVESPSPLLILDVVDVRVALPAGFPADAGVVVATSDFATVTNGLAQVRTPMGVPSILSLVPAGSNANFFLAAVASGQSRTVTLDPNTTAQALVFQFPLLLTYEPDRAARLLNLLQSDAAVKTLAGLIETNLARGSNALDSVDFFPAYQRAIESVLANPAVIAPAELRNPGAGFSKQVTGSATGVYPLEPQASRWVELTPQDAAGSFLPEAFQHAVSGVLPHLMNPVDWIIRLQEVDPDLAFPNGRDDISASLRGELPDPAQYPLRPGFDVTKKLKADLIFSRFNILSYLTKETIPYFASTYLLGSKDKPLQFPGPDRLFVMRAIGPSFLSKWGNDEDFVETHYHSEHMQVIGMTLVAMLIDTISAAIDAKYLDAVFNKESKDQEKLALKTFDEAVKLAPGIRTIDDALSAVGKLGKFFMKELASALEKAAFDTAVDKETKTAAGYFAKQGGNWLKVSQAMSSIFDNKSLKVISSLGQVAERIDGLIETSPIETTLVMVGDPFRLQIESVVPSTFGPGDQLQITLKGSRGLKAFQPNTPHNRVSLEGSDVFDLEITSVKGPDTSGRQVLAARIPTNATTLVDSPYTLYVNTQGRSGSATVTFSARTVITGISPLQGFSPNTNFAGTTFPGTTLFIQGANLSANDGVYFPSRPGLIAAKPVTATTGGLTLKVPDGAITGPIIVLHTNLVNRQSYAATSQVFTVLGPPVIESMVPSSAAIGDTVQFVVRNLDGNLDTVKILFPTNYTSGGFSTGASNLLYATVPLTAGSGPIRVVTPAGEASQSLQLLPSLVRAGFLPGSEIQVGGDSVINLNRAMALASGAGSVVDDTDYPMLDGKLNLLAPPLDPPYEEGDFVFPDNIGITNVPRFVIGRDYADTIRIRGLVSQSVVFASNGDSIQGDGLFSGDITLTGTQQLFSGPTAGTVTLEGTLSTFVGLPASGTVIITGNSNRIGGTFTGPVIVKGDYNTLASGNYSGTITLIGNHNNIGENGVTVDTIQGNAGPAALIIRGNENHVLANFVSNAGDAVVVDGGRFNSIEFNRCRSNNGNGLVLTGGAAYNQVLLRIGFVNASRLPQAGGGNLGHGVLLKDSASYNTLSGDLIGNGKDGLRFEGADVHHNTYTGNVYVNGGNGITVANGAHHNTLGSLVNGPVIRLSAVISNGNGGSGVSILGGLQTVGAFYCATNLGNGMLLSGVNEPIPDGTLLYLRTAAFGETNGNAGAGLRLEGAVQGVHVIDGGQGLVSDHAGVELDGPNVTGNTVEVTVDSARTTGIRIRDAAWNNLKLSATRCAGPGILLDGAIGNVVRLQTLSDNQGAGLRLRGSASGNHFTSSSAVFATGNQTGLVVEDGSHNNVFEHFGFNQNGDYNAILTGNGTSGNVFLSTVFVGAKKDGLLIEAGASDNEIGRVAGQAPATSRLVLNARDNGLSGIRITGAATRNNAIANCLFQPSSATNLQSVGLVIENDASGTVVHDNSFSRNQQGLVIQTAASGTLVFGNRFQSNTLSAITVSNAPSNLIGGPGGTDANSLVHNNAGIVVSGPDARENSILNNQVHTNGTGILLSSQARSNTVGPNNTLIGNTDAIRLEGASQNRIIQNTVTDNPGAGVHLTAGSSSNRVMFNRISANQVGIRAEDAPTIANTFSRNSIHGQPLPGTGILLANGANKNLTPPRLTEIQSDAVAGTTDAPDDSIVELFQDATDEGEIHLGTTTVANGRFRVPVTVDPLQAGFLFNLTATVTDPGGNTSPFGLLYREDFPPARILYTSSRDGNPEIYLTSAAGGVATNLTHDPSSDTNPAAVPDCSTFLFVSDRASKPHVYVADLQGGPARRLINDSAADYDPAWLTACKSVVFVSERDGNPEIYRVNLDGSSLMRLTTDAGSDTQPTPTPDGTKIVFTSTRSGSKALWIMNLDGSNPQPLLPQGLAGSQATWSSDGTRVAFVVESAGNPDVYTLRIGDTAPTRVTDDAATDADPAWIPGTHTLVFASNRSGHFELYSVIPGSANPMRLTVGNGDSRHPVILPK